MALFRAHRSVDRPSTTASNVRVKGESPFVLGITLYVALLGLVPLLFNSQFYFFADTPDGAYGQWYELGQQLRAGTWPIMNPAAWSAGNYLAEGQWGLWNPLVLGIALFVSFSTSAVVASTVVKIVFLVIGALGVYALVRAHGGSRPWAAVAAGLAPFAGFTLFMDATSWATNLFTWALFAWSVAMLRVWVDRGRAWILAAFVAVYLLVTIGYVQGTIMLVFYFGALLVEALVRRDTPSLLRVLAIGLPAGLIALAVYLPGVLTASVTARASGIANDGFLVVTLTGLFSSSVPSGQVDLTGWWGRYTEVPLLYITWLLPLLAFVPWKRVRRARAPLMALALFGVLATMLAVGPSELGPLRFPARTMPWIALTAISLLALVLSRSAGRWVFTRARVLTAGALWLLPYWLAFSQVPQGWRRHAVFAALTGVALAVIVLVWKRLGGRRRAVLAGVVIAATTAIVVGAQSFFYADTLISRAPYPDDAAAYTEGMPSGSGEGIVVGSPLGMPAEAFSETAFANMWYLTDHVSVLNLYTPVEFRAMADDLCLTYDGRTCPDAFARLFADDPESGQLLVDLLSIDSVQLLASDGLTIDDLLAIDVPSGWTRTWQGDFSVVITRDVPTPTVGSVTWASDGVDVEVVDEEALSTTFEVRSVPADGGTVALSRLAWPGYSVDGAELGDPLRGYLTTVELDASATDSRITVRYDPPGWPLVLGAMAAAPLLTAAFAVLSIRRRAARR